MHCNLTDDAIPKELGSLPALEDLFIFETNVRKLPNLDGLSNLKIFHLLACHMLQSIPDLPTNLRSFVVFGCPELKRAPDMSRMTNLFQLGFVACVSLVDFSSLAFSELLLTSLAFLDLSHDHSMRTTLNESIIWEIINKRCYNLKHTIVLGDDIPEGFTFINKGCSVCVDVPQWVNCTLEGFACCILYSRVASDHMSSPLLDMFVINHTKRVRVKINPIPILYLDGNNLWLQLVKNGSHYSAEDPNDLKLESGDKFSVVFSGGRAAVNKIGVLLLWENENASVCDVDFAGGENVREDAITLPDEGVPKEGELADELG